MNEFIFRKKMKKTGPFGSRVVPGVDKIAKLPVIQVPFRKNPVFKTFIKGLMIQKIERETEISVFKCQPVESHCIVTLVKIGGYIFSGKENPDTIVFQKIISVDRIKQEIGRIGYLELAKRPQNIYKVIVVFIKSLPEIGKIDFYHG
jgi:hypothetical protein